MPLGWYGIEYVEKVDAFRWHAAILRLALRLDGAILLGTATRENILSGRLPEARLRMFDDGAIW